MAILIDAENCEILSAFACDEDKNSLYMTVTVVTGEVMLMLLMLCLTFTTYILLSVKMNPVTRAKRRIFALKVVTKRLEIFTDVV